MNNAQESSNVSMQAMKVVDLGYTCSFNGCDNVAEYWDGCEDYICGSCKDKFSGLEED